jgi:hypothetical protein
MDQEPGDLETFPKNLLSHAEPTGSAEVSLKKSLDAQFRIARPSGNHKTGLVLQNDSLLTECRSAWCPPSYQYHECFSLCDFSEFCVIREGGRCQVINFMCGSWGHSSSIEIGYPFFGIDDLMTLYYEMTP